MYNAFKYEKKEKELLDKEYELVCELTKLRESFNLTQSKLAELIDTVQPQIFRIENNKHSPKLNTLLKILDVYGYTIEFKKK